ncbi:thymidylate synthase [Candidatus Peregrinibacteria bacterium]|nr:thymidylate synthase [Candidatus Peregrinibacteria bacterium]
MHQYLSLVKEILDHGEEKRDRTGTGTISIFGIQRKYDLRNGFPLLTTKKVAFKSMLRELLWFLTGATNINDGLKPYTKIWDPWADEIGELGPVYGYQWRKWERFTLDPVTGEYKKSHIDQIQNVIDTIKRDPSSRRLIVNAWNVADLDRMALPPCHLLFQFYVIAGRLDCQLYQRSADIALGVPFNIASYSTLMMMIAHECGLTPGIFTHTLGDAHIYLNHIEGLREQLKREPLPGPRLKIAGKPFRDLKFEDFSLENYKYHPAIKFKIAV